MKFTRLNLGMMAITKHIFALIILVATLGAVSFAQGAVSTISITTNVNVASNLDVRGSVSKGSGTFIIDHPVHPRSMLLYHSFVESPDAKNVYDGVVRLDENGEAAIKLPEYFQALNDNYRYQFFPLGAPMSSLYIKTEIRDNAFIIAGGEPYGEVSWQVTGSRKDPYIQANPIRVEVWKGPGEIAEKGECLFEPLCE